MKVNSLDEAKKIISMYKANLVKNYGVSKIGIFGSFVFNDFSPKSDIDILIDLSKKSNLGYFSLVRMENELSDKLGRKVDLVTKNSLKSYIKDDILKSVIYV
ncbi:MAG: polymerase beta domain protein region protein [Candidatus Woesebacteria bacterium GW2011_GWA1_33_30]|uniref:Polymerase beta domain protein region protein n=1 Tax=Candidatus Woesebacteria bacterium GW2011_GWA2_33_28 TaxID=1618561 RepID=A0A0G0A9S0_9BACT|nr:MAG: polymerase beta domain protein region protein [Candidatus Woesebacteria bacterium GW2011_GWA2_33_28]KKP48879.1 MAG: polymerase beta domain protein region protein [Candidatus Woesebacteria bacterium GW2011_GWA1_33_30]KKP50152.1 MAG: polymerase beta domain protein region protein [Microgenomates group bacterium GW2011_GWC1_33_32]KKP51922.1 MAG: polymerase beta domain protein region protein [Candidatus Woesebacteria bacterium GW2011_GWB1_33_38]KKP56974.1 MAG: polymerase beta domain protein 